MQAALTHNWSREQKSRVIKGLWTLAGDRIARSSRVLRQFTAGTVPACDELSGQMALAQAGDKPAYRHILTVMVPLAAVTARCAGVQDAAVDDLVRDVLLTVLRAIPTYEPSRPFGLWLQAIVHHCVAGALRSHGWHAARETLPAFRLRTLL